MYKSFIVLTTIFSFGCLSPRNQKLLLFRENTNRLTPAHEITYSSIFIVKNYCSSKGCENYIDSLVFQYYKKKGYKQYLIELYKESKSTNLNKFKIRPRDFEDYADSDHVLTYRFLNGKFLSKDRFRNGESMEKIDTAYVKIEPAPPLKQ